MEDIRKIKIDDEIIETNFINFKNLFYFFNRRKKLILFSTALLFTISIINLSIKRIRNPQFLGSFSIMIRDPILDKNRDSSGSGFLEDLAVNKTTSDIPTLIQYLKSDTVLSKTAKENNLSINTLNRIIKISVPVNETVSYMPSILKVDAIGPDKIKLNNILNSLSNDYLKISAESKRKKLIDGLKFLEAQRPSLEKRSININLELEKFRQNNKLIDPIAEAKSITSNIEGIKNKVIKLESENIRLSYIKSNLKNGTLFTQGLKSQSENSGLDIIGADQLLLQEILDVKSQLAKAQSTYKTSSSVVTNLQEKLNQLEPILLENQMAAVDAGIIVNKGQIRAAKNELNELETYFSMMPNLINEYSNLISKRNLTVQNLEFLLSAQEKLKLELSQGTLSWKIISKPYINPRPFAPKIKVNLIYGLLLSLFSGFSIAFLVDKLDNIFHSAKQIEEEFSSIPILGFVPFFKFNKKTSEETEVSPLGLSQFINMEGADKNFNFIFEETFRNIYTAIKFSSADKALKTIAISSAIPSEGKSLISILLAFNASEIDKKVLVIDTDLRRPTLHKKLEVDNVIGLSNLLVNDEYDWRNVVKKFKKDKNLFYITGGKLAPNPIKLLDSKKMSNLIKEISNSNEYDLVIVDCPPILGLSDSLIVSNLVDDLILTVSLNKVKKDLVSEAIQKLKNSAIELTGILINTVEEPAMVSTSNQKYYKYAYNYNYSYTNKYLPLETNNAYSNKNLNEENNLSQEKTFNFKNVIKKLGNLKNSFLNWIDE